ncbi:MAG: hypothetical protein IH963_06665 [Chloroflexi bacterium]|nr:hypothetical protein [Chloroflexota bacterium]
MKIMSDAAGAAVMIAITGALIGKTASSLDWEWIALGILAFLLMVAISITSVQLSPGITFSVNITEARCRVLLALGAEPAIGIIFIVTAGDDHRHSIIPNLRAFLSSGFCGVGKSGSGAGPHDLSDRWGLGRRGVYIWMGI